MAEIERLQLLYYKQKVEYGFSTDNEVLNAWRSNPMKYSKIFSTRMQLLSALQKYHNL